MAECSAISSKVGVLGGGQLGRMLMEAANRLNIPMNVLDVEQAPAKQISAHQNHIAGSFADRQAVRKLSKSCDVLTVEIEHVDTYGLEDVASDVTIEPSWQTIRIIQDKFRQKEHLRNYDIPMPAHCELHEHNWEEVSAAGAKLGYPLMLKSKTQAYDGRGNYCINSEDDIPLALEALKGRSLYAEAWAHFKMELAVMVVKTKDEVLSFPTVETVQTNSICQAVYAPARNVSRSISQEAQELARRAVAAFDGKGVFGVEMFLLNDDTLRLCEVACRVHNSGHYTIEACSISQFDAHLRAILDLPIPPESLKLRQPAIMLNLLGGTSPDSHLKIIEDALSVPNTSIHLYGKGAARPGRKMGHITITAPTMNEATTLMQRLVGPMEGHATLSESLRATPRPPPIVAVLMGSDSDLPTLVPGLRLLRDYFGIEAEVEITSAHRTPQYMAEYASNAASRGIKVLIAAAGGAAHLPGMLAAHTSLPVIGVPVKASTLDGVDSLYSIVQMPRGVPVATVGIGNSINAALLAVKILGTATEELTMKLDAYCAEARVENLAKKNPKLRRLGWEKYYEEMGKK